MALEICSPMDLVYECFVKLGLRYICVLRDGQYAGMVSLSLWLCSWITADEMIKVHKKAFVKYVKELEEASR